MPNNKSIIVHHLYYILYILYMYQCLINCEKGLCVSSMHLHNFSFDCFTVEFIQKLCIFEGKYYVTLVHCFCGNLPNGKKCYSGYFGKVYYF